MPLVFVHGVNVRKGLLYDREVAFRNRNFTEIFYKLLGHEIDENAIFNPYWGDLGAQISADTPFLPRGGYEMLWRKNIETEPRQIGSAATTSCETDAPLLMIAKSDSLDDVIDLLWEV